MANAPIVVGQPLIRPAELLTCSDAGVGGQSAKALSGTAEPVGMLVSANATTPPGRTCRAALLTASAGAAWYIKHEAPDQSVERPAVDLYLAEVTTHKLDVAEPGFSGPSVGGRDCLLVTLDPDHRAHQLGHEEASHACLREGVAPHWREDQDSSIF
ncbi:MAG TPA: hypothetical protein VK756_10340 [Solirubrobacteraceae bacterium]|nr:hypothetical protein [Solirubrobacteraceae bacterium]